MKQTGPISRRNGSPVFPMCVGAMSIIGRASLRLVFIFITARRLPWSFSCRKYKCNEQINNRTNDRKGERTNELRKDERTNKQGNERKNERSSESTDERTNERTHERMRVNEWTGEQTKEKIERMKERKEGSRIDGQIDGRVDKSKNGNMNRLSENDGMNKCICCRASRTACRKLKCWTSKRATRVKQWRYQ